MLPRFLLVLITLTLASCGGGTPVVIDSVSPTASTGDFGGEFVEGVAGEVTASGLSGEYRDSGTVADTAGVDTGGSNVSNNASSNSDAVIDLSYIAATDPLSQRVLYFQYNSSVITAAGEQIVRAHAEYLRGAPAANIVLEGHTDERGTREYNLALAEDRAQSVANMLQALGVPLSRIQTVSYGEERPAVSGNSEADWQRNRRVNILY